ncbi:hypothetical protein LJY18_20585 [Pseudomonas sp. MMS21-TM103]|uniref:hypothetical protein n=1 Tax=unclassified Pseudomonas TaxID=196821 RepID=UPI001EDE1812|nr:MULTISPECIES: hypothetical protein [unclassified Pseudomonas]MCG4455670.1 hypothetical protein [Pseudomonas sp. MMS21 TM103]
MISFRFLLLLLALLAMSACDDEKFTTAVPQAPAKPSTSVVPAPAADVAPTPAPKPLTKPVDKPVNEPARPKPKPAVVSKPVAKKDSVVVAPPRADLDLSLPADLFEELESLVAPDELPSPALLPPLFREEQAGESPFQLNGKLITNERGDDYLDSLEGAELQFEFKR